MRLIRKHHARARTETEESKIFERGKMNMRLIKEWWEKGIYICLEQKVFQVVRHEYTYYILTWTLCSLVRRLLHPIKQNNQSVREWCSQSTCNSLICWKKQFLFIRYEICMLFDHTFAVPYKIYYTSLSTDYTNGPNHT